MGEVGGYTGWRLVEKWRGKGGGGGEGGADGGF